MKELSIITFFILALSLLGVAQERSSPPCPTISVSGPPGIVAIDGLAGYVANVEVGENQKQDLQYIWSTSAGEIVSGQGTASIEVRQANQSLTVTVEVRGLPPGCPDSASIHSSGGCGIEVPVKIGQFGSTDLKRYDIELNEIVQTMNNNPNNQLFVYFAYKKKPVGEANLRRERKLIDHLGTEIGGRDRITSVRLFEGVDLIQFWRVPPGANNPTCEECGTSQNAAKP